MRLDLCNVQNRDAQIAVVLQRNFDQSLQARIGEEIAPANVAAAGVAPPDPAAAAPYASPAGNTPATGAAGRSYTGCSEHPAISAISAAIAESLIMRK